MNRNAPPQRPGFFIAVDRDGMPVDPFIRRQVEKLKQANYISGAVACVVGVTTQFLIESYLSANNPERFFPAELAAPFVHSIGARLAASMDMGAIKHISTIVGIVVGAVIGTVVHAFLYHQASGNQLFGNFPWRGSFLTRGMYSSTICGMMDLFFPSAEQRSAARANRH